jgi:hypothetical protein
MRCHLAPARFSAAQRVGTIKLIWRVASFTIACNLTSRFGVAVDFIRGSADDGGVARIEPGVDRSFLESTGARRQFGCVERSCESPVSASAPHAV